MNDSNSPSPGPTERLELYLDDDPSPAEVLTEGPFHVDLDTTALPNGEHSLRIVRIDAAGRSTEKTIPFTVDNAPEPDVTGLEPGATVAGRLGLDFAPPAPPPPPKRVGVSPWWYFIGSAIIFLGVYLFFILTPGYRILAPSGGGEAAAAATPVDQALMTVGQKVYGDNCQACHQESGTGMPPAVPALAGNTVLKDANTVLTTIHKGSGAMQAFDTLDAQQLAGVATYVRNSWGNDYGGVSVDTATKVTGAAAPSQPAGASTGQAAGSGSAAPSQPADQAAAAAPSAEQPAAKPAEQPAAQPAAKPAEQAAAPAPSTQQPAAKPAEQPAAQPAAKPAEQPAAQPAAKPAEQAAAPAPSAQQPAAKPAEQPAAQAATPAPSAPQPAAPAASGQSAQAAAQPASGGKVEYAEAPTKLTAGDGTELGTLSIGAKLSTGGQDAGKTKVTVDGWSMKGAESVIFLAMGTRVDLASLTDAGQKAVKVEQTKEDDYGTTWMQVSVSGLADPQNLVGDPQAVWKQASDLYSSTCSACHALHAPDSYTANQWPGTLKSMIPNTALTQDQVNLITKYLQYHAKGM